MLTHLYPGRVMMLDPKPTYAALQRIFSPKIRDFYGSGSRTPGLTRNFFFKSTKNMPKPVLVSQKKVWMVGGVCSTLSNFIWDFWNFLNFAKPLKHTPTPSCINPHIIKQPSIIVLRNYKSIGIVVARNTTTK